MSFDLSVWLSRGPYILQGFWLTLAMVAAVLAISAPFALLVGLALQSSRRAIAVPVAIASWLIRCVPPLIILLAAYYLLPMLLDIRLQPLPAAIWGFTLYNTFIFGEVVAAGLRAVPRGQYEAAAVLGLSPLRALMRIYLPQAARIITPPYVSYATDMVKSTALAGSIGVMDLVTRAGQAIVATNRPFEILLGVAVIYGVFDAVLIAFQYWSERRLGQGKAKPA